MSTPSSSAVRALALEYKSLQEEPVEGFRVKLLNDDNLFEWEVAIFGPPDTLYQGGYFKVSKEIVFSSFYLSLMFQFRMAILLWTCDPKRAIFRRVIHAKNKTITGLSIVHFFVLTHYICFIVLLSSLDTRTHAHTIEQRINHISEHILHVYFSIGDCEKEKSE